jgi:hypothetical protein
VHPYECLERDLDRHDRARCVDHNQPSYLLHTIHDQVSTVATMELQLDRERALSIGPLASCWAEGAVAMAVRHTPAPHPERGDRRSWTGCPFASTTGPVIFTGPGT